MNDAKKIIYNCRKATLLIEKKQLTSLSIREQAELKLHLVGCSVCRTFQQQSIFINRQFKSLFSSTQENFPPLNDEFKKDLQQELRMK